MAPALFLGRVFFVKDMQLWFYPSKLYWRDSVLSGELPLWIPQLEMGKPFLADPSHAVLYPLNVIALLPSPQCVGQFLVAHILLATLGAFFLARTLGLGRSAAMIAALGFGLGGYVISMAVFSGTYILSIAWMPLVASLAIRLMSKWNPWLLIGCAFCFGSQILSGEVQGAVFTVLVVLVFWICKQWSIRERIGALTRLCVAMVLALAFAAPQVIPTMQMLPETSRKDGLSYSEVTQWSMHPLRAVELVIPNFWGNPVYEDEYAGFFLASEDERDKRPPWMASPYFGSICLALVMAAIFAAREHRRMLTGLGILSLFTFLLALGWRTPVLGLLWEFVPGMNMVRYPEKNFGLLALILPLVAAFGMESFLKGKKASQCAFFATFAIFATVAIGVSLAFGKIGTAMESLPHVHDTVFLAKTVRLCAQTEASIILLVMLGLWLTHKRCPRQQGVVLVCGLIVQLGVSNLTLVETAKPDIYEDTPPLAKTLVEETPPGQSVRLFQLSEDIPYRKNPSLRATTRWYALCVNTGINFGVGYTGAYSSAIRLSRELLARATTDFRWELMNLFSCRFGIAKNRDSVPVEFGAEIMEPYVADGLVPFRNTRIIPFVRPVQRVLPSMNFNDALAKLGMRSVLSGETAVIEMMTTEKIDPRQDTSGKGKCRSLRPSGNTIQVDCSLTTTSWVVINESYNKNWVATIDGVEAPVHRANAIMMAVNMPAGNGDLKLEYQEPGLAWGLFAFIAAFIICLSMIQVDRMVRKSSR
ncbi:MAG: YfhO family protein [Proteobacteria bacterium]|nr:YfhO family protein [Pseudomonadota bacterium]